MPRLAPRIGVSLLVTLLFGPLSSTAHDSEDKKFEGRWSVIVASDVTVGIIPDSGHWIRVTRGRPKRRDYPVNIIRTMASAISTPICTTHITG